MHRHYCREGDRDAPALDEGQGRRKKIKRKKRSGRKCITIIIIGMYLKISLDRWVFHVLNNVAKCTFTYRDTSPYLIQIASLHRGCMREWFPIILHFAVGVLSPWDNSQVQRGCLTWLSNQGEFMQVLNLFFGDSSFIPHQREMWANLYAHDCILRRRDSFYHGWLCFVHLVYNVWGVTLHYVFESEACTPQSSFCSWSQLQVIWSLEYEHV